MYEKSVSSFDGELQNTISKLSDVNHLTVTDPTQLDFEPTPRALELQTRSHNGSGVPTEYSGRSRQGLHVILPIAMPSQRIWSSYQHYSHSSPTADHNNRPTSRPETHPPQAAASSTSSSSMVLGPCSSSEALSLPS